MPKKPDNVDITVRVPRTLTKDLKDIATKEAGTLSAVTRRLLVTAVRDEKEPAGTRPAARNSGPCCFFDLFPRWVDGPRVPAHQRVAQLVGRHPTRARRRDRLGHHRRRPPSRLPARDAGTTARRAASRL